MLNRLVLNFLEGIAAGVQQAEGWKWVSAHIDWPHAHGLRRTYPQTVELSDEQEVAYDAAQEELERLTTEWEDADTDLPPEADQRLVELEAEIERIDALRHAYDPDEIARGGVFVVLSHDGEARIERGFIRAEYEALEPEEAEDGETVIDGVRVNGDGEVTEDDKSGEDVSALEAEDEEADEDGKPLSDSLSSLRMRSTVS